MGAVCENQRRRQLARARPSLLLLPIVMLVLLMMVAVVVVVFMLLLLLLLLLLIKGNALARTAVSGLAFAPQAAVVGEGGGPLRVAVAFIRCGQRRG